MSWRLVLMSHMIFFIRNHPVDILAPDLNEPYEKRSWWLKFSLSINISNMHQSIGRHHSTWLMWSSDILQQFKSYCQTSNISCTLAGNKIVDHSDVFGASPVGTAPTISSVWTWHLALIYCTKTTTGSDEENLSFWIVWALYERFYSKCLRQGISENYRTWSSDNHTIPWWLPQGNLLLSHLDNEYLDTTQVKMCRTFFLAEKVDNWIKILT